MLKHHLGYFGVTGNPTLQPMYTLNVSCPRMSECDSAFLPIQNYRIWMLLRHSFKFSHDENLIAGSSDEVWVVSQGKVASFHGNFQDHRKVVQCSLNQVNLVIAINVEWFTRFTLPYKIETEA
ncbi:hypothetical protein BT93_B0573 [Corymbia citriodora subsp. variegata]|nr:hypothetical protein BT93_B0573 [Corymbia citriodora subsp. variegata]